MQKRSEVKKQAIKDFFAEHGRFPSLKSECPVEKSLGRGLANYCCRAGEAFDPYFYTWARSVGYGSRRKRKPVAPVSEPC